jgi:hypothetical protein
VLKADDAAGAAPMAVRWREEGRAWRATEEEDGTGAALTARTGVGVPVARATLWPANEADASIITFK